MTNVMIIPSLHSIPQNPPFLADRHGPDPKSQTVPRAFKKQVLAHMVRPVSSNLVPVRGTFGFNVASAFVCIAGAQNMWIACHECIALSRVGQKSQRVLL
jgi:hypothetical protein